VLVAGRTGAVASKVEKLQAGLASARGAVLCFVDDDVELRPDALSICARHLARPGVGAVFGLACYTSWSTLWSSLMSAFVNANALLSYVPLTYLTDPFSITGHCFALRAEVLHAAGGFAGLERHIDDDHALARRVRRRLGCASCRRPRSTIWPTRSTRRAPTSSR
jgi:ceramide glucosyltransferase